MNAAVCVVFRDAILTPFKKDFKKSILTQAKQTTTIKIKSKPTKHHSRQLLSFADKISISVATATAFFT